jgi:Glycosyl hydrolase family 26
MKTSRASKLVCTLAVGAAVAATAPVVARHADASAGCTVSAVLVNSCFVWQGVASRDWQATHSWSLALGVSTYEAHVGKRANIVHDYRLPGAVLSAADLAYATRPDTYLYVNWRPVSRFADAAGGNPTVNHQIDAMARSIKAIAPKKLFLAVYHEPENNVSGGATGCPSYKTGANDGTPAAYRAMWANVRHRFDALGVHNVVWVMNYMGYVRWDCMIDDLWPGNGLVDWVTFDPYLANGSDFAAIVGRFYQVLTKTSNASHDYLAKPWGLSEFATRAPSRTDQHAYYANMKTALDQRLFPKLKMLMIWDAVDPNYGDYRIGYDAHGYPDNTELADYRAYLNDPHLSK